MSNSAHLRTVLADALTEDGALTDPAWCDAAQAVPRELFLSSYFVQVPDSAPTSYRPVRQGEDRWLEGIYTDRTLITQLDGHIRPGDATGGSVTGDPTSSSTLPSLVLRMWQQLEVEAGQSVLEIGTGVRHEVAHCKWTREGGLAL